MHRVLKALTSKSLLAT